LVSQYEHRPGGNQSDLSDLPDRSDRQKYSMAAAATAAAATGAAGASAALAFTFPGHGRRLLDKLFAAALGADRTVAAENQLLEFMPALAATKIENGHNSSLPFT